MVSHLNPIVMNKDQNNNVEFPGWVISQELNYEHTDEKHKIFSTQSFKSISKDNS